MVIITSYSVAIVMCIITMLCWGSWANTQKLVSSKDWPFQLFYWDYAIGLLVLSIILAFTMGSVGVQGRSFLQDLSQASYHSMFLAFISGVIFNLSNILLVIAIEIVGMAVAFPIGVGLALVIGVITTFVQNPIGNPVWLFIGVALVVVAIILSAMSYNKLQGKSEKNNNVVKGVIVSLLAGILMGTFFGFVMASIGTTNYTHLIVGKLSPYSAIFVFSLGVFISNFLWNSFNMYTPITGVKCKYSQYITKGSSRIHLVGILGGIIWCVGTSFSIIASGTAAPSISYGLGQGATMIAGIWGVFIWREFKNAPKGTKPILSFMFLCYIIGLLLIIYARYA